MTRKFKVLVGLISLGLVTAACSSVPVSEAEIVSVRGGGFGGDYLQEIAISNHDAEGIQQVDYQLPESFPAAEILESQNMGDATADTQEDRLTSSLAAVSEMLDQIPSAVDNLLNSMVETVIPELSEIGMGISESSQIVPATVLRVIDGDTLEVQINGVVERVRLIGVDAPEVGSPGGTEATRFTQNFVRNAGYHVGLRLGGGNDRDNFGRLRRCVYASGLQLNNELLRSGNAVEVTRFGTC